MSAIPAQACLRDLVSTTCACGSRKASRQTFCRRDYFRLPSGLRLSLYDLIGEGYEEAYARALEALGLESPAMEESEVAK